MLSKSWNHYVLNLNKTAFPWCSKPLNLVSNSMLSQSGKQSFLQVACSPTATTDADISWKGGLQGLGHMHCA